MLLDVALPFVKEMLQEEREFIPFGAQLTPALKSSLVHGDVGVETPKSNGVIGFLAAHFYEEARANNIVAAAICFMGTTNGKDVAVFRMSHADGASIDVFLPYEIKAVGDHEFGSIFTSQGTRNFLRAAH